MEYRRLGSSGLQVSVLSYGSWVTFGDQIGEETAVECMRAAYDAGCNFFDNAEVYGEGQSEVIMGNAIRRLGWKRSDLVVSTKIYWGGSGPNDRGLSRKHVIEGTIAALSRLQLDYVDLVFCHRPDFHTPVEETVRAMNFLIDRGYAFYWGTSEWSAAQVMEAYAIARRERLIPPVMEQPEYNMFQRDRVEREYARLYDEIGLGTTIWSPLAGGLLTGKYNDGVPAGSRATLAGYEWLRARFTNEAAQQKLAIVRRLMPIAEELGCSMAQLALAWCAANRNVSTVITGASRPEQVRENFAAEPVVAKLTTPVLERIDHVLGNRPTPEPDYRAW